MWGRQRRAAAEEGQVSVGGAQQRHRRLVLHVFTPAQRVGQRLGPDHGQHRAVLLSAGQRLQGPDSQPPASGVHSLRVHSASAGLWGASGPPEREPLQELVLQTRPRAGAGERGDLLSSAGGDVSRRRGSTRLLFKLHAAEEGLPTSVKDAGALETALSYCIWMCLLPTFHLATFSFNGIASLRRMCTVTLDCSHCHVPSEGERLLVSPASSFCLTVVLNHMHVSL